MAREKNYFLPYLALAFALLFLPYLKIFGYRLLHYLLVVVWMA